MNNAKALANSSPAVGAQRQPWDSNSESRVGTHLDNLPRVLAALERWAKSSERLRRYTPWLDNSRNKPQPERIPDELSGGLDTQGLHHFIFVRLGCSGGDVEL